ncbi:MAG: hypothetical protein HRU03_02925 [Nanoarchaeales archaeon]|nr:hypothetical protein [Nanoarchaeales archaeon]
MNKVKKEILKKIDKNMKLINYGTLIFGIGLLIIIIASLVTTYGTVGEMGTKIITGILIMIGIVVGIINITSKESVAFLIAAVVVVMLIGPFMANVIQTFGVEQTGSKLIGELFKNIIGLIVPAALIVAVKTLFMTAKDE